MLLLLVGLEHLLLPIYVPIIFRGSLVLKEK